jgi:hypothetical protein
VKTCTKCCVEKPLHEFSKNAKAKDGLQHHCKACKLEYQRSNPRRKEVAKKYYDANREVCIARSMESVEKNREYYNQKMRDWVEANKAKNLLNRRNWYARNSSKDIERVRRRRQRIRGASVLTLADRAEIGGLYRFCQIFFGFEVDHIIPLNGKTVSGLHTANNLQVLTISENRRKGNSFKE